MTQSDIITAASIVVRNRMPMVKTIVMLAFIEFFSALDRDFNVVAFETACGKA